MKAAIMKELRLVTHPVTYALMVLGVLVLIPSWMYGAIFIYGILVAFFNGMNAREMHDLEYSFALPMSRARMVRARIGTMMAIETAMLLVMLAFVLLRAPLGINEVESPAGVVGTAANIYLVGFGCAIYGIFNLVFYPLYYRNPLRVGISFIAACIPTAVCIVAIEALPYLPIDGMSVFGVPGFGDPWAQLAVLCSGVVLFLVCGFFACRSAIRSFSRFDA